MSPLPVVADTGPADVETKMRPLPDDARTGPRALATSMATTGYATIREFQKAELVVAPSIKSEGKTYQTAQRVGMGH